MQPKPTNPYLRTKIMTASPEELRLMLYEGAIRFCRQAREALAKNDHETSYNGLMRAQKIVLELSTSLNHKVAPELCDRLSALYTYIYRRLVDGSTRHDLPAVDEAIRLLEFEKETWQLLMKQLADGTGGGGGKPAGDRVGDTGAQQTAISSLSLNG
ncbi:MAG: flagellar export chaperone FliS [Planctomycetes bacterium]|nr:flagellar export chaperone FliS [Planctomycetota bacterium]